MTPQPRWMALLPIHVSDPLEVIVSGRCGGRQARKLSGDFTRVVHAVGGSHSHSGSPIDIHLLRHLDAKRYLARPAFPPCILSCNSNGLLPLVGPCHVFEREGVQSATVLASEWRAGVASGHAVSTMQDVESAFMSCGAAWCATVPVKIPFFRTLARALLEIST